MNKIKIALLSLTLLTLQSCVTAPAVAPRPVPTGNVERLTARPDFDNAVEGSAAWVTDSLNTVNGLQAENERLNARLVAPK